MDKLRKIRRHLWKELLKINKSAKFESDLLKTNEEIAPETREIVKNLADYTFLGNCPPTPPLCQPFALSEK